MHMMHFFKDLDYDMENKGDKLVITIKGDKEKIAKVEKKLKAMKDLCDCGEEGCCGDKDSGCCC
jgi:hypothetical protein